MKRSIVCIKCGAEDWQEFPSGGRACRSCRNKYKRGWRARTGDNRGPKKAAEHRKHLYGLSETEYTSLRERQENKCAACRREAKLVVDHDHETGKVRGLLCTQCNVALGMLQNNLNRIYALVTYVEYIA